LSPELGFSILEWRDRWSGWEMGAVEMCTAGVSIIVIDSVTHLSPETPRGSVIIAASHGGLYSAYLAALVRPRGVILNDAGFGRDHAGDAALAFLNRFKVAAAVISHWSARIGDGNDTLSSGVISGLNPTAMRLGCFLGQRCADAAATMKTGEGLAGTVSARSEGRYQLLEGPVPILGLDSASLVQRKDSGTIVITGSHGGLLGNVSATAIKYDVMAAVYHDAGIGKDRAGVSRLWALEQRGIPAAAVKGATARIGDARSIWATGKLSTINSNARAHGAVEGMSVKDFGDLLVARALLLGTRTQ